LAEEGSEEIQPLAEDRSEMFEVFSLWLKPRLAIE
jgi:hypothetical protein